LAALSLLTAVLQVHYLPATFLAVELAIVHNFVWHERWTWKDRPTPGGIRRLARFNVTTGLVSLVGNLALMPVLVQVFRLGVLPANLVAIAACSLANFLLADRVVFATPRTPEARNRAGSDRRRRRKRPVIPCPPTPMRWVGTGRE